MKKRVVIYATYCCAVILVLASFLVYKALKTDDEAVTAERATRITINCPHEITVATNTQIQLEDGFITVEPANAFELLDYSLSTSSTTAVENFIFDFTNKTFVAKQVGFYYIEFSVPKNKYSSLKSTLKIHAIADTKTDVSLKTNQIMVGQTVEFSDIFKLNNTIEYQVEVKGDNLTFSNNSFVAIASGKVKVFVTISNNFVKYTNEYELNVFKKEQNPDTNIGEDDNPSTGGDEQGDEQGNTGNQEDNENPGGETNPVNPGDSGEQGDTGNQDDSSEQGSTGGTDEKQPDQGEENNPADDKHEDDSNPEQGGSEPGGEQGNTGEQGDTGNQDNTGEQGSTGGTDEKQPDQGEENNPSGDEHEDDSNPEQGENGKGQDNEGNKPDESEQKPEQQKITIEISDESFDNYYNSYIVEYCVKNGDNKDISQKIKATVSDNTIAKISSCNSPFVRIEILKSGTFTLTISLVDNPEVSIAIEISVVLQNEKT